MSDRRQHETNGLTESLDQRLATARDDDDALAHIVDHFAADSGTIHFIEPDGLLHLAAGDPRHAGCRARDHQDDPRR